MNSFFRDRTAWLLILIITGAFFLRFVWLSSCPAGFFRDEADKGYTTYGLMKTGMDQAGHHWPLFVRAMNVTTSALYQYMDMPFIAALGLTETAVRLPACLAGTVSVFAVFLLARIWWGNAVALFAAFFVALSPWSLVLSRWANQSSLLPASIPLAVYFFVRDGDRVPSSKNAFLSAICFLLAFYTYEPAQLFVPVFMILLWIVSITKIQLQTETRTAFFRSLGIYVSTFAMGSIPMAYHLLFQPAESTARLSRITILDGQPLASALREWLGNYLAHFSPYFLFIRGDENLRHSTAVFGQLHWYILPLLIAGIAYALRRRSRIDRILLVWLLCFPIAAACTRERIPHALRSVFAVPVFQLFATYGIVAFCEWKDGIIQRTSRDFVRLCVGAWCALVILCPGIYLYDLYFRYPLYSAMDWEYGYRQAVTWWNGHRGEADHTTVTGLAEYPYVFFLFYGNLPPDRWITDQTIPNVEFRPTGTSVQNVNSSIPGRTLYLIRGEELPMARPEDVIQFPSGEVIWKWVAWGQKQDHS